MRLTTPFLFAALVAAAPLGALVAPLTQPTPQIVQPAKSEKTVETRTVPLAAGSKLIVKNVNGHIRVSAWDKEEVAFTGEFKPSSRDEQVKVHFEPTAKGLTIRGEYPKSSGFMYRGPVCNMDLKVPRRVLATLETVNGAVELSGTMGEAALESVNGGVTARDLQEDLKAGTVNGGITLENVKGSVHLETVNGGISAWGLDGKGKGIKAETVNGSVSMILDQVKGRLTVDTVNGGISFNARGAEQVDVKRRHVTATFPGSTQTIKVSTVNGAVTIK